MIDEMTLFDVEMQYAYWAEHPPLGLMIEGFLGVKAAGRVPEAQFSDVSAGQQAAQLMALTGAPGIASIQATSWDAFHASLGLSEPTFDPKELAARQ